MKLLAQLIKLFDLISRYEMNIYRYPSQYIRLKKQGWNKFKHYFENSLHENKQENHQPVVNKKTFFKPLKSILKRESTPEEEVTNRSYVFGQEDDEQEVPGFHIDYQFTSKPKTEEELKQRFLDGLFEFQVKWASSTIREKSYLDKDLYDEDTLKYFLQRFPDNYLVLYHPVFLVQRAPVELEVVMISPTETWCITVLEGKENSVFIGSKERFWTEKYLEEEKKHLNPVIAINRMEKVVNQIYNNYQIDLPIRKVILNRTGYFDFPYSPPDILFIDKRKYEGWFRNLRKHSSPIKHVQLKAAQVLLQHCQTTYVKRPEWNTPE
ncbi:NERD domain-containing protein [Bacillus salitolerans]|uniref:NERD domain-containing protein n=1 Tax=Bacillus salitolerans TaxID=1437434 RepID=A0ABW4LXK3_9BACI